MRKIIEKARDITKRGEMSFSENLIESFAERLYEDLHNRSIWMAYEPFLDEVIEPDGSCGTSALLVRQLIAYDEKGIIQNFVSSGGEHKKEFYIHYVNPMAECIQNIDVKIVEDDSSLKGIAYNYAHMIGDFCFECSLMCYNPDVEICSKENIKNEINQLIKSICDYSRLSNSVRYCDFFAFNGDDRNFSDMQKYNDCTDFCLDAMEQSQITGKSHLSVTEFSEMMCDSTFDEKYHTYNENFFRQTINDIMESLNLYKKYIYIINTLTLEK